MTRPPHVSSGGLVGYAGHCKDCGKICFTSKRAARAARRSMHEQMSVYRCGPYWHLGHLPEVVRRGRLSRDVLGPAGEAQRAAERAAAKPPKFWPGQPIPTPEEPTH